MKSLVANLNWILLLLIGETRAGPFPVSIDHGEPVVSVALITVRDDPSGSKSEPSQLNVVGCAANADGVSARSKNATINSRIFSASLKLQIVLGLLTLITASFLRLQLDLD